MTVPTLMQPDDTRGELYSEILRLQLVASTLLEALKEADGYLNRWHSSVGLDIALSAHVIRKAIALAESAASVKATAP